MLRSLWPLFEEHIFSLPTPERQFNPYRDHDERFDQPNAPAIRRQNLRNYLSSFEHTPPLFLLAEAPGPWGCRFSGVPFTSEAQLADEAFPISGRPSSTKDAPHKEYSASIVWRVMRSRFPHFFLWNSLPFHPHQAGEPLSIRTPGRREVAAFEELLEKLLRAMHPRRIAAVGRKAERALTAIGADATYVRHPSQGGAKKFEAGMQKITREMNLPA